MADPLCYEIAISSQHSSVYWWPLIFEAMGWNAFSFSAPDLPKGKGYYYYIHIGNESDTDFVQASFRAMWDEIYKNQAPF